MSSIDDRWSLKTINYLRLFQREYLIGEYERRLWRSDMADLLVTRKSAVAYLFGLPASTTMTQFHDIPTILYCLLKSSPSIYGL